MITQNAEEYLEAIYRLAQSSEPAGVPALAEHLGVSTVSANEMIRKLERDGMVTYQPYKGVYLTPEGEAQALDVVRRHRLWERFLVDVLEIPWEDAHQEACGLEHASSGVLIDRLERFLGEPDTCPHGHAVPSADGEIADQQGFPLTELPAGAQATILCVPEDQPGVLTYLSELHMRPGEAILMEEVAPFEGPLTVRVAGSRQALGRNLASLIIVGLQ
jgi:DtxR family Mn-dependent transcriptional regulator